MCLCGGGSVYKHYVGLMHKYYILDYTGRNHSRVYVIMFVKGIYVYMMFRMRTLTFRL